jgi:Fe-S cluster biosynthesis and repair protein YggX
MAADFSGSSGNWRLRGISYRGIPPHLPIAIPQPKFGPPAAILKAMSTEPGTPRKVFCVKLKREMEGLPEVPFEGHPLGQRIYDNVSKQAWGMWVEHMKMLMNEYRLNLGTQQAQEFLLQQMEQYFFGEGSAPPPEYVAATPQS